MIDQLLLADLTTELPSAVRLQRLLQHLRAAFGCGAVALLKLEEDQLRPVAVDGLVQETLGRRFQLARHPRLALLLNNREPILFEPDSPLPDPYDGLLDSHLGEPLPVHDCMGASLQLDGRTWGVVTLDSLQTDTFDEDARLQLAAFTLLIEAVLRMTRLEQENRSLRQLSNRDEQLLDRHPASEPEILTRSNPVRQLLQELQVVAGSDLPVLLLGETGVGKELFARQLHRLSTRHQQPLVQVNCAALPEHLAESELFGHVRGAFSGAHQERAGRFEAAAGGTLFLDEVGELPLNVQAKLLRALQNGEIQRLGSDQVRQVDVRIIAATNRQLQERVRSGDFRADLYHRLSVYPVPIPPLRDRPEDILLLTGHFLERNRARLGLRCLRLSPAAEQALLAYDWPGNVRELEHVISRAALKALSRGARQNDLTSLEPEWLDLQLPESAMQIPVVTPAAATGTKLLPLRQQMELAQRQAIQQALAQSQDSWAEAARLLQTDASNLHKLAKRLGLKNSLGL